jgi:hypothetical protein
MHIPRLLTTMLLRPLHSKLGHTFKSDELHRLEFCYACHIVDFCFCLTLEWKGDGKRNETKEAQDTEREFGE